MVIEHIPTRLKSIGISKVFGVVGAYAISVDDEPEEGETNGLAPAASSCST
jgi:hypothetical protein